MPQTATLLRGRCILPAALLLLSILVPGADCAVALVLDLYEDDLLITGVTPGADAVLFSVAREPADFNAIIVRRLEVLSDTDSDGLVRWEVGQPVPFRSIWVAVDLASGELALATPEEYPLREAEIAEPLAKTGPGGALDQLEIGGDSIELLVVRPGVGAWVQSIVDGGEEDDDEPANRLVTATVPAMEALGASPPAPLELVLGDLVIGIDPDRMEVFTVYLTAAAPPTLAP
jgi:hypothetical protein